MNAEQANGIDLSKILEKLGFHPAKAKGYDLWYHSPFRKENTPSFHVHVVKNVWYDFAEEEGGTVIDFVCAYLKHHSEDHTVKDALRWLKNMQPDGFAPVYAHDEPVAEDAALSLVEICDLQSYFYVDYLNERGIPLTLARKYLKEVYVRNSNTGKTFSVLGFRNEGGGYELRHKFFKGCIAPKDITFIRGKKILPDDIHVFEGMMDFLSALAYQKANRLDGDAIILNSTSCLSKAFPYIKDYSYKTLYSWLDNDTAGEKAALTLKTVAIVEEMNFQPMNDLYAGHKDVNEWHMNKIELKP